MQRGYDLADTERGLLLKADNDKDDDAGEYLLHTRQHSKL